MTRRHDTEELQHLEQCLKKQFGEHALVYFPNGDLVLVTESKKVVHHAIYPATIEGCEIMCILVERGTCVPFPEREIVSSRRCSDELACLISIADLYYGIWREYDPPREAGQVE